MFCLHCGDSVTVDGNAFTHDHGMPADGHNVCPTRVNRPNWIGESSLDKASDSLYR